MQYIVVGGMAMIQQGYLRATEDIDLLLEASQENIDRVRDALKILPDEAVSQLEANDLHKYTVVRVADAVVVDLMLRTSGIDYDDAKHGIEWSKIEGVEIPFASAELLFRMKQTGREKDRLDLMFLQRKLDKGD